MTFLIAYLTAHRLRARLGAVWATVVALGCGWVGGALYAKLFGALFLTRRWVPATVALVADVILAALVARSHRRVVRV
jgi:hypothetical protein